MISIEHTFELTDDPQNTLLRILLFMAAAFYNEKTEAWKSLVTCHQLVNGSALIQTGQHPKVSLRGHTAWLYQGWFHKSYTSEHADRLSRQLYELVVLAQTEGLLLKYWYCD